MWVWCRHNGPAKLSVLVVQSRKREMCQCEFWIENCIFAQGSCWRCRRARGLPTATQPALGCELITWDQWSRDRTARPLRWPSVLAFLSLLHHPCQACFCGIVFCSSALTCLQKIRCSRNYRVLFKPVASFGLSLFYFYFCSALVAVHMLKWLVMASKNKFEGTWRKAGCGKHWLERTLNSGKDLFSGTLPQVVPPKAQTWRHRIQNQRSEKLIKITDLQEFIRAVGFAQYSQIVATKPPSDSRTVR